MSTTTFAALCLYSFVASVTPGPNNVMLFASGVNFGMRRTIPHACGIGFGFGVLLAAVGAGLGVLVETAPVLLDIVKIAGAAYMVYLAWRIANSGPVEAADGGARPMTFLEAALFQWVNPKAIVMAITAMGLYTAEGNYSTNVAIVVATFVVINFPSVSIWAGFGTALRGWLADPSRLRIFNWTMATALIASLWPMIAV